MNYLTNESGSEFELWHADMMFISYVVLDSCKGRTNSELLINDNRDRDDPFDSPALEKGQMRFFRQKKSK